MWHRVAGEPGPGETAVLIDGPGFDFDGIVAIQQDSLVVRGRDEEEQRIPVQDILWLLRQHGHVCEPESIDSKKLITDPAQLRLTVDLPKLDIVIIEPKERGMTLEEQLETRWMVFAKSLGANMNAADETFSDLVKAYSGPGRHYHSLQHIKACLDVMDALVPTGADLGHVELALWWHDFVYVPGRSNNEDESTFAMHRAGRRMDLNEKLLAEVAEMIPYTKHAASVENMADRFKYLVDVDLSILGEQPEVFDQYEKDIRLEYEFVPWEQFRLGRGKILNEFLARPNIYATKRFRDAYEAPARENLKRSLGALVP